MWKVWGGCAARPVHTLVGYGSVKGQKPVASYNRCSCSTLAWVMPPGRAQRVGNEFDKSPALPHPIEHGTPRAFMVWGFFCIWPKCLFRFRPESVKEGFSSSRTSFEYPSNKTTSIYMPSRNRGGFTC